MWAVHCMYNHVTPDDLLCRTSVQDFRTVLQETLRLCYNGFPLLEWLFPSLELLLAFSPYCFSSESVQNWSQSPKTVFMLYACIAIHFIYYLAGNSGNKFPPYSTSSSAYLYFVCWSSLYAVLTKQLYTEAVWLCQLWSTTSHWWLWCSWGQRLCSCSKSWSLVCLVQLPPSSLLLCHLYAGVSVLWNKSKTLTLLMLGSKWDESEIKIR